MFIDQSSKFAGKNGYKINKMTKKITCSLKLY